MTIQSVESTLRTTTKCKAKCSSSSNFVFYFNSVFRICSVGCRWRNRVHWLMADPYAICAILLYAISTAATIFTACVVHTTANNRFAELKINAKRKTQFRKERKSRSSITFGSSICWTYEQKNVCGCGLGKYTTYPLPTIPMPMPHGIQLQINEYVCVCGNAYFSAIICRKIIIIMRLHSFNKNLIVSSVFCIHRLMANRQYHTVFLSLCFLYNIYLKHHKSSAVAA